MALTRTLLHENTICRVSLVYTRLLSRSIHPAYMSIFNWPSTYTATPAPTSSPLMMLSSIRFFTCEYSGATNPLIVELGSGQLMPASAHGYGVKSPLSKIRYAAQAITGIHTAICRKSDCGAAGGLATLLFSVMVEEKCKEVRCERKNRQVKCHTEKLGEQKRTKFMGYAQ